jgi:cytochrome c5
MRHALTSSAIAGIALLIAAPAIAADAEAVYNANCAVCHKNLKPKLGDKAAWEPLLKQGEDALVASVIRGKGAMQPRAGKPKLSDDDIRASVQYMISKVK